MRTLNPPETIEGSYFLLLWDRDEDNYILSLIDGRSYELGTAERTLTYLRNVLQLGMLGERAMDSARNWKVAAVLPSENRCFGVETKESVPEYQRFFEVEQTAFVVV